MTRTSPDRARQTSQAWVVLAGALLAAMTACTGNDDDPLEDFDPGPTPVALIPGETMYLGSCLACHGDNGTGTPQGPPLVDEVYRPAHHADAAFHLAVQRGVVQHHWRFGDMAPIEGLPPEQVDQIIAYVRWLQRRAGIE